MATKTKFPFEADEVVISNTHGFFTRPDGVDVFVHVGDRLRSSNPTVHRFPQWFCSDDQPVGSDQRYERVFRGSRV